VHRWVVLLALAACELSAPAGAADGVPPASWLYPPAPAGFPLGAVAGQLGRSQAPQPIVEQGIAGPAGARELVPLHLATAWPIPGPGPARGVFYGSEGDHTATELIDIDGGRVVWRDTATCAAPIVGATADTIVCADASGTRAIGLDGKPRWSTRSPFIAATGSRIVVSGTGEAIILDVTTGHELTRVKLPRGVTAEGILATCGDAGRELLAIGGDGRLVRVADGTSGPVIAWAAAVDDGPIAAVDACEHAAIVVTTTGAAGAAVVAIGRATGKIWARVDGVRGWWAARDGSDRLEIATAQGVASYPRGLVEPAAASEEARPPGGPGAAKPAKPPTAPAASAGPGARVAVVAAPPAVGTPLDLPPLGELLASRGELRLVRATPLTAVVLDRGGVRAYLPLAAMGAVLGETSIVATSWTGSPGETLRRVGLPPRWNRRLRLPPLRGGVAVDAELRDLPPVLPLALAGGITQPDTGMYAVAGHAIDPSDGAALYAIAVDRNGERAAVARADLLARKWRWQRVDGCGAGAPVAIAVARDVVVCGTRGARATVRATSRDGAARWEWISGNLDTVTATGDAVVIHDGSRITVLDARDGQVRGHVASDDGAAVRAAIVDAGEAAGDGGRATLVVTAERGRVVGRLGSSGFLPVWSIAVAGVVRGLAPSGAGVLVELEDGDAYRIEARTGAIVPLPGLGLRWHAAGDLVTGDTLGGPIPAPAPPLPKPTAAVLLRRPLQILRGEIDTPAPMSTPIPPPPPLGDSWQLTVYELTGGLRARNDYALPAPVAPPAVRGPAGSPLVVACGPGLREVVVIDPRRGDPLRRVRLPDDVPPGAVFGTVVDGSPVAGAVLASPLRVVLF